MNSVVTSEHAAAVRRVPRTRRMRMLVAIASYGVRNLELLNRVIEQYRKMDADVDVDVVVVSDAEKPLGRGVEVVVGLPAKDPWSLPFAHKAIFAERVDEYDLFAYSEDDMAVTEENIRAFLRVTPALEADEIAGFLRYEVDANGAWSMPDAHGHFHWRPESVRRRGPHIVAEFTNEHAAYYMVTQAQLRRAIASGGFLRRPYEGRYDMLCSAATDVYTGCGFRKVVCISSLRDFLIHHASNRYAGKVGASFEFFNRQVDVQLDICQGRYPASSLCRPESRLMQGILSKNYDEPPCQALLSSVPPGARRILSIGCGWGATEDALRQRGAEVTVMPLDSVMGALAAQSGMHVVYGPLEHCLDALQGSAFDCVVMSNLLHLLEQPDARLRRCAALVGQGGSLVVVGPHLGSLRLLFRRLVGRQDYRKLRSYEESGVHRLGPRAVRRSLANSGMEITGVRWIREPAAGNLKGTLSSWSPSSWVLEARRGGAVP